MGLGGISIWQLTHHPAHRGDDFRHQAPKGIGADLGGALKGFRKAMSEADKEPDDPRQLGKPDAEFPESDRGQAGVGAQRQRLIAGRP